MAALHGPVSRLGQVSNGITRRQTGARRPRHIANSATPGGIPVSHEVAVLPKSELTRCQLFAAFLESTSSTAAAQALAKL
jgi:hypothetical protein